MTGRDLPILFSGPMVRALLGGTKTQTRRIADIAQSTSAVTWQRTPLPGFYRTDQFGGWDAVPIRLKYAAGDRLYVREAWRAYHRYDLTAPRNLTPNVGLFYEADHGQEQPGEAVSDLMRGKFRQAMHMPRWASRLTLPVTDVRVERLQDISEADAIAEGVYPAAVYGGNVESWLPAEGLRERFYPTAREAYLALWDHINGPGSADANPWVAAYSFTIQLGNIDQLERAA